MDIRKIETIKDGDKPIGSRHRVKVVKNKVSTPFRLAEFDVMGTGISREGGIMDVGVEMEIIQKSGAFYRYNDQMIGQGKVAAQEFLKENPDIAKKMVAEIMAKNKEGGMPLTVGIEESDDTNSENGVDALVG
jgi:recombination protein RecA